MFNINSYYPLQTLSSKWVIYNILNDDQKVLYLGSCQLGELFNLPDARKQSKFNEYCSPGKSFILTVTHIVDEEIQAKKIFGAEMKRLDFPIINKMGFFHKHANVICNETGEEFRTLTQCCAAHGINQPALSQHLNGKGYVKSIKGRTYRRK